LLLLAGPIIVTLFEQGRFGHEASLATARALQAYALGLVAFCWTRVLATACYAAKDATTPMRYAAFSVTVNIAAAGVLMWPLGHVGLALATSLASWVNAGLLFFHLRRRHGQVLDAAALRRMLRACMACAPMVGLLLALRVAWPWPAEKAMQAAWLTAAVGGGLGVYVLAARLLGEPLLPAARRRGKG